MAKAYWIGTTSGAFTTDTNWDPVAVPSDGDEIWLTERSTQSLATALTIASKDFPVVIATPGYKYSLGSVGNEFEPADGIGEFIWQATGAASEAHLDTEIDYAYINTPAQGIGVTLHGTTAGDEMTTLHLVNGLVTLGATFNFVNASIVRMVGGRLVIPSGVTMGTGNQIIQSGGTIETAQTIINYSGTGGELVLSGAAAATLIALLGPGRVTMSSTGTLTAVMVDAGVFDCLTTDKPRTITTLYGSGSGRAILGHDTTLTNAVKGMGWRPEYPV